MRKLFINKTLKLFMLIACSSFLILSCKKDSDGSPKIVPKCTLPLTAMNAVDMIITDLAVFTYSKGKLALIELMPGAGLEEVRNKTTAVFTEDLK